MAARLADRVVCIGPAPAAESYLRADAVVHAALATGCDAIHPGYGFLSENPALAAAARENGLRFVGPPAEVLELAGDKLRARARAAEARAAGGARRRTVAAFGDAAAFADETGYPLLLKAAAGGGGRGIKLAARRRRSCERAVRPGGRRGARGVRRRRVCTSSASSRTARHVEVQVAADDHGAVVHLGERDCSVQRRYQKLIEEAPAPSLADETRAALRQAAVAFARAIGYRNLGTVEFLVDAATEAFYFLEMNGRIQVEHPVTEAVTGRDLVAEQLTIAAGEPLGFAQDELAFDGHAIECRLTAEDERVPAEPGHGLTVRDRPRSRACASTRTSRTARRSRRTTTRCWPS